MARLFSRFLNTIKKQRYKMISPPFAVLTRYRASTVSVTEEKESEGKSVKHLSLLFKARNPTRNWLSPPQLQPIYYIQGENRVREVENVNTSGDYRLHTSSFHISFSFSFGLKLIKHGSLDRRFKRRLMILLPIFHELQINIT